MASAEMTSDIVQRLAQKFGLQETEVQAVFDEVHQERHQKMKQDMENRLNQAVQEGKITESQKQAILDKFGTPIKFEKRRECLKRISNKRWSREEQRWKNGPRGLVWTFKPFIN
jgi:hypothetical protein